MLVLKFETSPSSISSVAITPINPSFPNAVGNYILLKIPPFY